MFRHHAQLLVGERDTVTAALFELLKANGVSVRGNPDFWHGEFDTFGVGDAANVKGLQSNAAVSPRRVFVIAAHRITHEAQNALLKMLEEGAERTYFFLIVPHAGRLLPTVLSRMELLEIRRQTGGETGGRRTSAGLLAEGFLKASAAERLALVLPMIEMEDGGVEAAIDFLNGLERALYEKRETAPYRFLEELGVLRRYLESRSPSRKMILEHLALTAPTASR